MKITIIPSAPFTKMQAYADEKGFKIRIDGNSLTLCPPKQSWKDVLLGKIRADYRRLPEGGPDAA